MPSVILNYQGMSLARLGSYSTAAPHASIEPGWVIPGWSWCKRKTDLTMTLQIAAHINSKGMLFTHNQWMVSSGIWPSGRAIEFDLLARVTDISSSPSLGGWNQFLWELGSNAHSAGTVIPATFYLTKTEWWLESHPFRPAKHDISVMQPNHSRGYICRSNSCNIQVKWIWRVKYERAATGMGLEEV